VTLSDTVFKVVFKVSFIGISVVIDHVSLPLDFVVDPVALILAAILVEDLALTMFEAVFELACVDVASRADHHALALHLALSEVALVEVPVRERLVTVTVEVGCVVLD